ncbi:Two-component system response regulator [Planctomycetales bacterium 10988]|nr:Two-component system response regulator [Planctomycetales bacterium 10988]
MGIRLLIVDDHEVVRTGIRALVRDTGIQVVGEAETGEQAMDKVSESLPDVVLLDVRLENSNGFQVLESIRAKNPTLPILILSTYDNPTYIARAMALGAKGYLLKGAKRATILEAIEKAAAGEDIWTPQELRRITGSMITPRIKADLDVPLTEREAQVLRHIAYGLTNKEIAKSLDISIETVKEHVQHILRKVGVSDRTQAAVWAVRNGIG